MSCDFILLLQVIDFDEHIETGVNTNMSGVDDNQQLMILGDSQLYQIIYGNVLYYPVMYVVPLGTLALLNVRLISSLNAIKRRALPLTTSKTTLNVDELQNQRQRRRRKDDNITLCVVVIVCVFIVCQTPALFNQIFWALFALSERQCGRFHFYYTKLSDQSLNTIIIQVTVDRNGVVKLKHPELSDLLVVVNSSCNFIVYCLFGTTFRRIFLSTISIKVLL